MSGTYPPGSIFKLITALAGLESEAFDAATEVDDQGTLEVGIYRYANWYYTQYGKVEGKISLSRAIARSNDIFFYKAAEWTGVDALVQQAEEMGFGKLTGLEVSGEKAGLAVATLANEVLTSGEFCSMKRRISHLLTMYGFIIFVATSALMIFECDTFATATLAQLWHTGAIMLCLGGYWFWFSIRVDVAAEGTKWYHLVRADIFIVSLFTTATFALIWSYLQSKGMNGAVGDMGLTTLFFVLFIISNTTLFASVLWSKFAHMFFKPAAALQKRIAHADGSNLNLPGDFDLTDPAVQAKFPDIPEYMGKNPENMGAGIRREAPNHY